MNLTAEDKVRLLRDLTRGADDVFAVRTDRSWRPVYTSLPDSHIALHLGNTIEIGSYALIPFGNGKPPLVRWVAADFDGKKCSLCQNKNASEATRCEQCNAPLPDWRSDVQRATEFLIDTGAPLFVNLSRSAQGAHLRVLFNEPVPAWMARRWFNAWLEEAGVLIPTNDMLDDGVPKSFDRLIPPQDFLNPIPNDDGTRKPGNLVGSPLNGKLARKNGGTLPLDPKEVALGNFEPDGLHWEHTVAALEARSWGAAELKRALDDAPGSPLSAAPEVGGSYGSVGFRLPVIQGNSKQLEYAVKFCEFMRHIRNPRNQSYQLWLALATELHRFGEDGRDAFHEFSKADSRYSASETDHKWRETAGLSPVRCDTLVAWGFRCPHLRMPRCNGAKAPAYFADNLDAEIL